MDKTSEQLIKLSDRLDQTGKKKCANAIDEIIEHQSLTKIAQYVGVIGYVLKQNRAMGNCIRKKRASSDVSMQEIVLGCLKEYQDGQQYDNNEWTSKYAQVVQQVPDQFGSSHTAFLEALAEENKIEQHASRVKLAKTMLEQEKIKDVIVEKMAFNLEGMDILSRVLKEGDVDPRPFKLAAPQSDRSRWSRFWSPSWTRRGTDKDTQFEMDAVLDSLANIQNNIQQIRGGISRMRYDSRGVQDPTIQQHLQALSDTNWEQTTNGIHNLNQALKQSDPSSGLAQTSSQIEGNIKQIFGEINKVQKNMYNLRLRDPVKGRGSLKSATEEYADLSRALDRLYMNPLDERALHYSLKLHGRLEDTLNERASAMDPSYNDWVNDPGSELGRSRFNDPGFTFDAPSSTPNPSMTMDSSAIEDNLMKMMDDPNLQSFFMNWLAEKKNEPTPNNPELKQAIRTLLDLLQEKQSDLNNMTPEQPQPNVVQTGNEGAAVQNPPQPQSSQDVINSMLDPTKRWKDIDFSPLKQDTASSLQKMTKVADVLSEWNGDLAELLREYIHEEEDQLPDFPHISSIIKEHEGSRQKLTENKAGAVALGT